MDKIETRAIRTQLDNAALHEHSAPIFLTSSFVFESAEQGRALFAEEVSGNIYSRFSNPNVSEFITKMVQYEGAEDGLAYATGMAAIFGSLAGLLNSGDHVLACRSLFGSTHQIFMQILPRWGITCTYVDANETNDWEKAIKSNTRVLFIETPSNPGLDMIDLEWIGHLKAKYGLILIVDNTFATPYLQNPIVYGADVVLHSATKFIDGQGRVLGGVAVGKTELVKEMRFFARQTGPSLSPFNAWLLSKSLETLAVRMDRHCQNALELAEFLDSEPEVEMVKYPFLASFPQYELARKQMKAGGGVITFNVKGGYARAARFIDALKMLTICANLGDTRTIITHPASTTHSKLTDEERAAIGIFPGLIRASVGLENPQDIIADIAQALENSK
ncbi:aminotransferase class I/II-fold pyridoxal phosphate-dependent enzyme [candidate division KSB1 bacterium]|nr:aminotransferase class I/II-fold pyridoxal phosphate-dependent enzyme [candidate division KSB1 bacterium]